jgi:hypothetical protein
MVKNVGNRACAVFAYAGEAMAIGEAKALVAGAYS